MVEMAPFFETNTFSYISDIVPRICDPGDDEQHGSSAVCDVQVLQALSRRVHLGKFVAESKFQVCYGGCVWGLDKKLAWSVVAGD